MRAARHATPAWAALLAAGLALSAWQLIHHEEAGDAMHAGHRHAEAHRPVLLHAWQPADAVEIRLEGPAGTLRYLRGAAGWETTGRPAAALDPDAFLTHYAAARRDRLIGRYAPEAYGLEPARLRITISGVDGGVLSAYDVGDLLPDGLGRYLRPADGGDIIVVPDYQTRPALLAAGRGP
ncbi:electron transporter SenC [Bordetella sp. 2513F-2]